MNIENLELTDGERPNLLHWGCLVGLFIAVVVVGILGVWLFTKPAAEPPGPQPTAIVWTATPTPTPTPVPTPTAVPLPPGVIGVGVRVQVAGTGASGLSIRAEPSTAAERLDVAQEEEVFFVAGGPREADGYVWWFLRDEAQPDREGWAASDFLARVE